MNQTAARKPPELRVRPARVNDAAPLGAFFMESWKEVGPGALGFTGATEEAIKEIASKDFLVKRLSSPNTRIVVAEKSGRILGFASIRRSGQGVGELSGIVVLKGETSRGLGTKLVRKAFDASTKLGLGRLVVKTEAFNVRAIGFYEKNGFTRKAKATEKIGRTKVPIQVLEKRLR